MKLKNKSKEHFKGEISSGRFPPYIIYKVVYTSPEQRRLQPALMRVDLEGTDKHLKLSFDIMEEACKFHTWYACVSMYVYALVWVGGWVHVCVFVGVGACVCVMWVCVGGCMGACMHVCM